MADDELQATGRLVTDADGEDWYRIDHVERMAPFLMTVVSDADLWMFVSSAGPLTAGRVDADHALLPYETDDRLHRAAGVTGPVTVIARQRDGHRELWRPFGRDVDASCTRAVAKRTLGNALLLEEHNADWGLTFRARWTPSPTFGWVRTCELVDVGGVGAEVEVLDGLLDVMPAGIDALTEQIRSNLVDAYKRTETGRWGTAALFTIQSRITDRAEPAESLEATVVWSHGLPGAQVHVDERVVDAMLDGRDHPPRDLLTGRRGSYLLRSAVTIVPGDTVSWETVADTGLSQAAVVDRLAATRADDVAGTLAADVAAGEDRLRSLLAGADAFQRTGDPMADAHHLSNVLFNTMRGGVFPYAYTVPCADFRDFLAGRNRQVHGRHADAAVLGGEAVDLGDLRAWADGTGDPDLVRLVLEYLPLTFSRRHGDPSRPWNKFSIRVRNDAGDELLTYEGNWRDIFQNWEALLRSYPGYHAHVVAKFVNASTPDGHNPYRISRDGIDWEVPDPEDPWSNIGYWGDHQIVYLLRLLEGWDATDPDGLADWLARPLFTYADVPYRIADHAAMVRDPRDTISFDEAAAAAVDERVAEVGADGRLVVDADGDLVRVTLAEKLLTPALAKLAAHVPGGGIWMNTQRPEWNDANNALAGWGLSMVTLYQLERYVTFVDGLLGRSDTSMVAISAPIAAWLEDLSDVLADADPTPADDAARRRSLDAVAATGERHRAAIADGFDPTPIEVEVAAVRRLLQTARTHLQASIAAAQREDGLVHSYNLLSLDEGVARVEHLAPMLEGQVAVLATSAIDGAATVDLVDALFRSPLHREDLGSFLLYPEDIPAPFLDRNTVTDAMLERAPGLRRLADGDGAGIVERDHTGAVHFGAGMHNAEALGAALAGTDLDEAERAAVVEVYEDLFDHHAFTGRSSGMFGYEGLGSIYWHMVAKLLLAVAEQHQRALDEGASDDLLAALRNAYRRIRDGLGSRKEPATFGAIPLDCYSHSPSHSGAQQPGMTGQVKEEVLARADELGLRIVEGQVRAVPPLLPTDEVLAADGTARWSLCEVPVTIRAADRDEVVVTRADGSTERHEGAALPADDSGELFGRTGEVVGVEFLRGRGGRG